MFELHSAKAAQIKKGRFFRRMVDMFAVPADLLTENHRRLEAEASDEVFSSTTECVKQIFHFTIAEITAWQRGSTLPLIQDSYPTCPSCKIT